jgi:hypothetical protein
LTVAGSHLLREGNFFINSTVGPLEGQQRSNDRLGPFAIATLGIADAFVQIGKVLNLS